MITAILVIGIKESAHFNATIVIIKVARRAVRHPPGPEIRELRKLGHRLGRASRRWVSAGSGSGAAYIFFAYIGFDAVSTTAQEAKNPQRDLPIGIIASLVVCTILYILVAGVLTGMVPWQEDQHRSAARRGLSRSRPEHRLHRDHRRRAGGTHQRHAGDVARPDARALLDGQRRAVAAKVFRRDSSRSSARRTRTPSWSACWPRSSAASRRSIDIGKMVNIGTLLAFVIVCIAVMVLRNTNPDQPRPFRTPWVPLIPVARHPINGYMMYKLGWINWARLIIWLAIGLVIYFTYSRHHSRVQKNDRSAM